MKKGQVILEFTFSMIVIMIMIFAIVKVFQWAGTDLAERSIDHDEGLSQSVAEDWSGSTFGKGPAKQIDPYFHKPLKMNAVWSGY